MWMLSWPRRQKLCRSSGTGGTWRELTLSALCETKVKTKHTHTYTYIQYIHVNMYRHTYICVHTYTYICTVCTTFEAHYLKIQGRLKQQLHSYFHPLPVCLCTAWERRWTFKCLWRASVELQGPAWKGLGWFSHGPLKPYRAVKLVISLGSHSLLGCCFPTSPSFTQGITRSRLTKAVLSGRIGQKSQPTIPLHIQK